MEVVGTYGVHAEYDFYDGGKNSDFFRRDEPDGESDGPVALQYAYGVRAGRPAAWHVFRGNGCQFRSGGNTAGGSLRRRARVAACPGGIQCPSTERTTAERRAVEESTPTSQTQQRIGIRFYF